MSAWKDVPTADELPGYRVFVGDVEKPSLDDRQYSLLELHNGLRAVLVHDPTADKAAACLAVTTGYMLDPDDAPGLAHFCEHMVSKGSGPYPAENDFLSFISTNGGSRNAATGPTYTEYWFSISPTALAGGLPRLAAFFHAPLFTESLTAREINAVDSEFKRNLQNDSRRGLQITKSLSAPGHPWAKFGTGNYASLSGVGRHSKVDASEEEVLQETRRRLVDWWREQYCASRMTLAVVGREALGELTSMVVPHFSKIINRGLDPRPAFKEDVWTPEQSGAILFIETVKDYHTFSLSFPLPDLREQYGKKPASFLAHFLGHEGPGSVCAYLKKKGWLLSLSAGPSGSSRAPQFFQLQGRLTVDGYMHYQAVVEAIFNYISLLRSSPLPLYHFNEISALAATRFRFKQKSQPHSYASVLAHALAEPYPPEWLLSGAYLYRDWDEALVRRVLDGFVPERARVILEAKMHREDVVGENVQWETEEWYGTRYAVRKMDGGLLRKLREGNANDELFLPAPNPFIPEDLSVDKREVPEPGKYPLLVKCTTLTQLWHKKDDQFWVPKAHVRIDLKSPIAYVTPRHAMLTRVFVDLVDDALAEVTYDADLAGLSYSLTNQIEGLTVSVGGYNDKLHVLLRAVLEKMRGLQVEPDRLRVVKEKVQREYENFYMGQPSSLSECYATWLFMPTLWTPAGKLPELSLITADDIERHRDDILSRVFIEALINGNASREARTAMYLDALNIADIAENALKPRPLLQSEITHQRSLVLRSGSDVVSRKTHANPKEVNSSLSYYLQFGVASDVKLRCTLALIAHMTREPCYSILRTEEQLGYVVASAQWSVSGMLGLGIRVQSVHDPAFLESRVDAFLETLGNRLTRLSAQEFAAQKDGLVVKKLERVKNLGEETARYWGRIRSGDYDFLRRETDVSVIRELTLGDVMQVYDTLVRPSSGHLTRKKLSVHLLSQQLEAAALTSPPAVSAAKPPNANADVAHAATADSVSANGAVQLGAKRILLEEDEDGAGGGGTAESVFKAGLACAPAVTPVRSPALGECGAGFAGASAGAAGGASTDAAGSAPGEKTGCGTSRL
ncbi:LuxS/MPP-like metallohydrolase [Trametes elegans]|nr:LuxS/MPP-like metallohydrolase [Trametes elegans]